MRVILVKTQTILCENIIIPKTSLTFKELFDEIDFFFRDGEFFSGQIIERGRLSVKRKAQALRIQCLIAVAVRSVVAVDAVLAVAEKRMTD